MRIVDLYIMKTVLASLLLALFLLAGLDTLFAFVAELEDLTETYRISHALVYSVATFPRRVYEFIPIGSLLGALISMGLLASRSELVVMRAAGISVAQIVMAVLKGALLVVVLGLLLAQWVIPHSEGFAENYQSIQQTGGYGLRVNRGSWHRDGEEIIHINGVKPNTDLVGVTRYAVNENNQLLFTSFSELGQFNASGDEQRTDWTLSSTRTSRFGAHRIQTEAQPELAWKTELDPELLDFIVLEPDNLSITALYGFTQHLRSQGLSHKAHSLAFWKKVLQPVATIGLLIIATSFVFGQLRSVTMGFRVLVGLMVGLIFNYLQEFFGYSSLVYNIEPWVAASMPVAVVLATGAVLVARVK